MKRRKGYICYACRNDLHYLCAADSDPKHICTCDKVWHVQVGVQLRKFKGTTWIPERERGEQP